MLLISTEAKGETRIVALDGVQQSREASVMVEPALVLRAHEKAVFSDEYATEVHGPVAVLRPSARIDAGWRSVRLKAVYFHFYRGVLVPARFRPQRFAVTTIAISLATEELVASFRGVGIKVNAGTRLYGRQC